MAKTARASAKIVRTGMAEKQSPRSRPPARPQGASAAAPRSRVPTQRSRSAIDADILAYNKAQSAGDRRICETLANTIHQQLTEQAPGGLEHKIWHRHPVWFLEGNPIVGYHKLKDCVRLLFWSGRSFDERGLSPEGNFQTAGARYTAVDQIDVGDLERWIEKSIAIQWDYKNIVKRKGRLERLR